MAEALAMLPIDVRSCGSFAEAQVLCKADVFDLIISDINLADGNLFECLHLLPSACKKLAVSAELSPACVAKLLAADINAALLKPMTIADLHSKVSQLLELSLDSSGTDPLWDDEKAFAALGRNEQILQSLKGMFKTELPLMVLDIELAFRDGRMADVSATLHKLKASCGFLGAKRLLQECHRLDKNTNDANISRFLDVAQQTLALI